MVQCFAGVLGVACPVTALVRLIRRAAVSHEGRGGYRGKQIVIQPEQRSR